MTPVPGNIAPTNQLPPVPIKPKLGRNFLTCSILLVFALLVLMVSGAVAATKLGVVSLPYLNKLYVGPKPTRLIASQPLSGKEFQVLVAGRCYAEQQKNTPPPHVIEITEGELTGALQTEVEKALRDERWKQDFTQVVAEPGYLELYGRYSRGWFKTQALIRFKPNLENGALKFVPTYVQVGDIKFSPQFSYKVLGYIFSRDLGAWQLSFGDNALQDVRLDRGVIQLYLSTFQKK